MGKRRDAQLALLPDQEDEALAYLVLWLRIEAASRFVSLADASRAAGLTAGYLGSIGRDGRWPSARAIVRLARAWDVPVRDLIPTGHAGEWTP